METSFDSVNEFLVENCVRIRDNPCISGDFCLFQQDILYDNLQHYPLSVFHTAEGQWELAEAANGDCFWIASDQPGDRPTLKGGHSHENKHIYPATWENLLILKNLIQAHDPHSTIFPSAVPSLQNKSLGIGARLTTLHWPAVEYAMVALNLPVTANQNSIPRELVYCTDTMTKKALDTVPFKFIGSSVPEGHQGQSVEGMSHGAVLSKLKTGFHRHRIPWLFNADHLPVGGKFDEREDRLVAGSILASYVTFDLSPGLSEGGKDVGNPPCPPDVATAVLDRVRRIGSLEYYQTLSTKAIGKHEEGGDIVERVNLLITELWPAVRKLQIRDNKLRQARIAAFSTKVGRTYFRELSIDELAGLTPPLMLATILAMCEKLGVQIHYVAPNFGFQKNFPFEDNALLEERIEAAWAVCKHFDVSIGFHSGSGKSAENYRVCGRVTQGNLEVKTSGRYTYEFGAALHAQPKETNDHSLWREWYRFTLELSVESAFGSDVSERDAAREFITRALKSADARIPSDLFASKQHLSELLNQNFLSNDEQASPDHMFWFEYNFLYVLAAGGLDAVKNKALLGDHGIGGMKQRARFYGVSDAAKLNYSQRVVAYIVFLAQTTGLVEEARCQKVLDTVKQHATYEDMLSVIGNLPATPAAPNPVDTYTALSISRAGHFGKQAVQYTPLTEAERKEGWVLVRVKAIGICGTDYHAFEGTQPFFSYPRILGHELGVEIVDADVSQFPGLIRGRRCAVRPYLSCGHCVACGQGKSNCCMNIKVIGVHIDGGMQPYLRVPAAHLHPSLLGCEELALVETLCIGQHAVSRAGVTSTDRVVILGAGPIGMAAAQAALASNAEVFVADFVEDRLAFCRENLNVRYTVRLSSKTEVTETILSALKNVPRPGVGPSIDGWHQASVVIDATGNPESMNNAVTLLAAGGRLAFVGLHTHDLVIKDSEFHRREATLIACRNSSQEDFSGVIALMEMGKIDTKAWISHRAQGFDDFLTSFPQWVNPESGVIKAMLVLED